MRVRLAPVSELIAQDASPLAHGNLRPTPAPTLRDRSGVGLVPSTEAS
jgi:hypothetical protein